MLLWQKLHRTLCKFSMSLNVSSDKKRPAGTRSLHLKMQIKGVWGTSPTSILQRKKCFCIDENIACTSYASFQTMIQNQVFPTQSDCDKIMKRLHPEESHDGKKES